MFYVYHNLLQPPQLEPGLLLMQQAEKLWHTLLEVHNNVQFIKTKALK